MQRSLGPSLDRSLSPHQAAMLSHWGTLFQAQLLRPRQYGRRVALLSQTKAPAYQQQKPLKTWDPKRLTNQTRGNNSKGIFILTLWTTRH